MVTKIKDGRKGYCRHRSAALGGRRTYLGGGDGYKNTRFSKRVFFYISGLTVKSRRSGRAQIRHSKHSFFRFGIDFIKNA